MKYKIGDVCRVLKYKDFDIFVNGVNCQNHFGSDIAKIIKEEYPQAKQKYHDYCDVQIDKELGDKSSDLLGDLTWIDVGTDNIIVHAFTQDQKGYDGKKYASYDAIDTCFADLAGYVKEGSIHYRDAEITYPLVGCGLGGLQWSVVSEIIDYRLKGLDHYCIVRREDIDKYKIKV